MAGPLVHHRDLHRKKAGGTLVQFPAGTQVFGPGRPARRVYFLNSGCVELTNGPRATVELVSPGHFFGEKCLLIRRQCDQIATTLSPVLATAYRRSELFDCLRRDLRFAGRLLRNLALRMDRYEQAIRDFVTERCELRLALLLFRFAPTRPPTGWVRLPIRATNIGLARMVGMTRWRVSHFLNEFQRMGWLSRREHELWINRGGLKNFLQAARAGDTARSLRV
jgi:CRP-like cAMP-binding protein